MGRVKAFGVAAVVCALAASLFCGVASASSIGHRYARATKTSSSQWDGARAYMEVRAGAISADDAAAGLFIANTLWVYTNGSAGDEWVEAGYTRGWNSQDVMTGYWAAQKWSESQTAYVYAEHKITNCTWTAGDWHWFKIMHHSGTTTGDCSWQVFIDGDGVESGDGVHITTSHERPYSQMLDAGLEVTASTGKLGTISDPCGLHSLSVTTNEQASWSNLNDPGTVVDPGYSLYGGWSHYPSDFEDYRNW